MSNQLTPEITMEDLLKRYPGAQRALFQRYHIGGCSSCGFKPTETLRELCQRNNGLNVQEVMDHIVVSHDHDQSIYITPADLSQAMKERTVKWLDIRTREEWDAVHVEGALFFTQDLMNEVMGRWPKEEWFVICDHKGTRSLDGAAYFAGHGFKNVRALKGGIDAWAAEVDPKIARYDLEHG